MRTYYRSADVVITDDVFAVTEPVPMRFRLERLRDVHIATDDVRVGRLGAAVAVALTLAATAVVVWRLQSLLDGLAAALIGVVVAIAVAGRWWGRAPGQELRAGYGGDEVCLFRSADPLVFGQVRRGLIRALEGLAHAPTGQVDR